MRIESLFKSYHVLAAFLILMTPMTVWSQTGVSIGYTGQHDAQRGQVFMLDWVPGRSSWDLTAGAIRGTETRDTNWVAASYEIVDQHLYAAFGPALIRHQTSTLTSQYQFMTTFGYHYEDWSLAIRHLSNGGLRGGNIGETVVVVAWNF